MLVAARWRTARQRRDRHSELVHVSRVLRSEARAPNLPTERIHEQSKRDCFTVQNVERQLARRFGEMGMPNLDSSELPLPVRRPSAKSPVSVVVVDDHPVILEGLIKILNSQKDTFLGQRLRQS